MPRFSFRLSQTDAIEWTYNRHPEIAEELTLGDRGVFRVTERLAVPEGYPVEAEYAVERIRDATSEDLKALYERGVNTLP